MKKHIFLLIISVFLCFHSFSQKLFSNFEWDSEELTISSVEMKVSTEDPKKIIFEGFKDGKIQISNVLKSFPTLGNISIKLGGYLEMDRAGITNFQSEVRSDLTTIIKYSIEEGDKFAALALLFDESQKLITVSISATNDLINKKSKIMTFVLKGFD